MVFCRPPPRRVRVMVGLRASPIFRYVGEPTRRSRHGGSIREATFLGSSLLGLRPDDQFWFRFCLGVETGGFIG